MAAVMTRRTISAGIIAVCIAVNSVTASGQETVRRLPVKQYVDKMKAGWVGQMAGVGWGGPTEFRCKGVIMPETRLPKWRPEMINQFNQDDIYVEMTFLRTLEVHGLDASIRQAGIDFAASGYRLWHANRAGRDNLRKGIAPPDSGHPKFNKHADDIDYQIEADFAGLIAPGMPNVTIALGEKFGRLMNYGDGLYGGQFVGGMYAEAFFETDPVKIVRAGLACIPQESLYAQMVRDMLAWHAKDGDDWQKAWQLAEDKYHKDAKYTHGLCSGPGGAGKFSIDAKLNGAYIIMGLLYGKGDPDKAIIISTRCGQDSDCNPSNTAGVLFTTIGFAKLPERFTSAINPKGKFSHTPYTFPKLIEVCQSLARQAVIKAGGRVEKNDAGEEVFVIPVRAPKPGKWVKSYQPGPAANSKFTKEEMDRIKAARAAASVRTRVQDRAANTAPQTAFKAFEKFAPGWTMTDCGRDMDPGLLGEHRGRKNVFMSHPLNRGTPCVLSRKVSIPAGGKTTLQLAVSHYEKGDWTLIVRADDRELLKTTVGKDTAPGGWREIDVDLTACAGKTVALKVLNQPSGWSWEAGYWAKIAIKTGE